MKKLLLDYLWNGTHANVFPHLKEKGIDVSEMEKNTTKWENRCLYLAQNRLKLTTSEIQERNEDFEKVNNQLYALINANF